MSKKGIVVVTLAYVMWGLLPLFWQMLDRLSPFYILNARMVWSFVFCLVLMAVLGSSKVLRQTLTERKTVLITAVAGIIIASNWFTYIWAVNNHHVLDASMGYYMNPLLVVLFGALFFGERLTKLEWLSLALAAMGVLIMIWQYGRFPWVSLYLAVSFAGYGAIKKFVSLDTLTSLTLETMVLFPLSLILLVGYEATGYGVGATSDPLLIFLSVMTGVLTAGPLLLFGYGVKTLPFAAVGYFQYISPTLSFLLGLLVFKEPFNQSQASTFAFIWSAVIIYIGSKFWEGRQHHKAQVVK